MADLQTLINAIPVAEDGHVISREYHNSLRNALVQLADLLQATPTTETVAATYAPNFLAVSGRNSWLLTEGVASKSAPDADGESSCDGWFPIHLPDGARLQKVRVIGARTGAVPSFSVQLLRQPLTDSGTTTLCSVALNGPAFEQDPFQAEAPLRVSGLATTEEQLLRIVDNSQFKYLIKARVAGAPAATVIQIYAIRVEYAPRF